MAALLLLAAAALPQAAFGQGAQRTVRIAAVHSQNGAVTSVDLAVSAGSEAVSLYAVHGAVDRGSDLNAWDAVDPGTPVPASESETTVNYPIVRPHDVFYRFVLASFDPPFKKQLAFLKSTGSQYFILGDKCPNQNWRVVADAFIPAFVSGQNAGYWGARKAAYDSAFLCLCEGGSRFRFDMAGGLYGYGNGNSGNKRYQIDESNQGVSIAWDGGSAEVAVSSESFTSPCPMALFAVNSNGTPGMQSKMTLYGFRVWTNRTDAASLVYDLIPCVKDDDTVTLYNRVDGSFLSPAAGSFAYDEADVVAPTVGDLTVVGCSDLLTADKQFLSVAIPERNGVLTARLGVSTGFEANTVLVAYGFEDAGDNPAHWDNCAILGNVAADATSFSAALPFEWSPSVRCARFFTVPQSNSLGERILKSSGSQYIVTDYTATSNTLVEARVAFPDTSSKVVALWTGRESASSQSFGLILHNENGCKFRVDYGGGVDYKDSVSAGSTLHTVSMGGLQFRYDNNTSSFPASNKPLTVAGAPLTFFAMNSAGTISYISNVSFAEVKIWSDYADETSLVRHLKPGVRDGRCGSRDVLEGGKFYPNSAESGDDFEVVYPGLRVLCVSEPCNGRHGLVIIVR